MPRIFSTFLLGFTLFTALGCTSGTSDITLTVPEGFAPPVSIASIAPVVDNRSWEEKAEGAMRFAEAETVEFLKEAEAVAPAKKLTIRKYRRLAKRHHKKPAHRLAHRKSISRMKHLALK